MPRSRNDFEKRRVIPTSYSVSTFYIQSCVIEVSDDGGCWKLIDERHSSDLNGKGLRNGISEYDVTIL